MPDREEFLKDIIICAVEGGTGYWAAVSGYNPDAGRATLHEWDEDRADFVGQPHKLTIDTIRAGLRHVRDNATACAERLRRTIIEADLANDAGDIDAEAADVIAQLGIFGELIYG